jgi:hypothetical protein
MSSRYWLMNARGRVLATVGKRLLLKELRPYGAEQSNVTPFSKPRSGSQSLLIQQSFRDAFRNSCGQDTCRLLDPNGRAHISGFAVGLRKEWRGRRHSNPRPLRDSEQIR